MHLKNDATFKNTQIALNQNLLITYSNTPLTYAHHRIKIQFVPPRVKMLPITDNKNDANVLEHT